MLKLITITGGAMILIFIFFILIFIYGQPLKSREIKHQPDRFRNGSISKEELSAIKKALKTIQWSRNADPKAAADEDYAAILKECQNSNLHYLLTDLITEAASNNYQPDNQAANSTYINELISDFENGVKADRENQEVQFNATAGPFP
jgi:hypothetical protein